MTRKHSFSRVVPLAVTAVAALLLVGCGGGGGGGGGDGAPTSGAQGSVSGNVVKGPVTAATVKAFAVSSGGAIGAEISTATTDAQGAFTMPIGNYSGPLMLQMSGGTYTDEATGSAMAMGAADMMTAVLPAVSGSSAISGVEVTPLTSMAQAMALHLAGGLTSANISLANAAVGNYFLVDDILHARPMNPLVAGSGVGASQSMMNYGMALAAMSQYAKGVGTPTSSGVVTAMMNDASDGLMDGRAAETQVMMMGAGMMGGGMMQSDAGRTGLATALVDFMNSSFNKSGVGATNMSALTERLRNTDGRMH